MKRFMLHIACLIGFVWLKAEAQDSETLRQPLIFDHVLFSEDSLRSSDSATTRKPNTKFVLNLDSRHSILFGRVTKIGGLRLGLEFYERYRFGIGFYGMRDPMLFKPVVNESDTIDVSLLFQYNTLFMEYVLYKDFRWELSVPFSFGSGTATVSWASRVTGFDTTRVFPKIPILALNLSAHYKFVPWLGLGAGLGFRQVVTKDADLRKAFNSPIAIFKVKFFLSYLYKCIFKPQIIKGQRETYNRQRREKKALKTKNIEQNTSDE